MCVTAGISEAGIDKHGATGEPLFWLGDGRGLRSARVD
jgi:hypothetical protein